MRKHFLKASGTSHYLEVFSALKICEENSVFFRHSVASDNRPHLFGSGASRCSLIQTLARVSVNFS